MWSLCPWHDATERALRPQAATFAGLNLGCFSATDLRRKTAPSVPAPPWMTAYLVNTLQKLLAPPLFHLPVEEAIDLTLCALRA
jgi:hypothetical protein